MSDSRNHSLLRCMYCGAKVPLYGAVKFRCICGGLYDVVHDFSKLPDRKGLKEAFQRRLVPHPSDPRTRSGVWRFHELVMPSLGVDEIVTLGEGLVPILPAGKHLQAWIGGDLDLWLILEGLTMTGSFKDFGMTAMISVAKASGVKITGCASTGDTSASVAAYAAAAGMQSVVILPGDLRLVTDVQRAQPLAHGSTVINIEGDFDAASRIVQELVGSGRMFPANSINPTRIEGHQATVFLAAQFFGWTLPDYFAVPIGNGSDSSSIGKGMWTLKEAGVVDFEYPSRIIGGQSRAANPLARSWEEVAKRGPVTADAWRAAYCEMDVVEETTATAASIGKPVSAAKVIREVIASRGAVLTVEESDLNEAVMVAGSDGHLICPQTGMALAALKRGVREGHVEPHSRVVAVSTATGLKFSNVPVRYGKGNVINLKGADTEAVAEAIGI